MDEAVQGGAEERWADTEEEETFDHKKKSQMRSFYTLLSRMQVENRNTSEKATQCSGVQVIQSHAESFMGQTRRFQTWWV